VSVIEFGPQITGDLDAASSREWLVTDGLGGYAMGTVGGVATRRYHGLLMVAKTPPIGRMLGLAALDPVITIGTAKIRLGAHEWNDGTVAPTGHIHLASFELRDGLPKWRWAIGDVVLEAELAMMYKRPAVGVVYRLVRAPSRVRLDVEALCTWRDAHGERTGWGEPWVQPTPDGFVFEDAYRVRGPNFDTAGASWYRGLHHREEAARGLNAVEDVWFAGRFTADLAPGDTTSVEAWADDQYTPTPAAPLMIAAARRRAASLVIQAKPNDDIERTLALAADQFIVTAPSGPTVVAGYPWFGDWSRDTMTSYEGLFLRTQRWDEGRTLLTNAAHGLSDGMLANTADAGGLEYNTVDAAMWFFHAVGRHVSITGDTGLAADLSDSLLQIIDHHHEGTRFGIRVDTDGLVTQGEQGWALTWMDARVDGTPITPRTGKPVEVNALWVNGLRVTGTLLDQLGHTRAGEIHAMADTAADSFTKRFVLPDGGLLDVADPDDASVRPNQLLAASLPFGPITDSDAAAKIVRACGPLVAALGLRSLSPADPRYTGAHRGDSAARDRAYHQGTVWPWMIGPYADACRRAKVPLAALFDGLYAHLREWGLGSVSETTDGDAPYGATGCPFQAWSVAELLRAKRGGDG
jgi:predicted glycogen debranching enzyme